MFDPQPSTTSTLTMASYEETLACILREANTLPVKNVSIQDAIGHTLAEDLSAPISVPSFDNSAMDGFAFAAQSVENASPENPIKLPIVGASIAGDTAGVSHLALGHAAKIMTGAPLPEGADTILPVERASWEHEELTFTEAYPIGKHVRKVGQDIRSGETILEAGTRLAGHHVPLLCASGFSEIPVFTRPIAAWIATGQEISDDFDKPLEPGHIYNATGLYGRSLLQQEGVDFTSSVTVKDTPQDFAGALENTLSGPANIILSTGGVSAGQYDFVRPVLEDFGAEILVHKTRIKPGKPILFAKMPGGKFFFGLPGNPISTALGLRVFTLPFVRKLTGRSTEMPQKAILSSNVVTTNEKTVFLMANVTIDDTGTTRASLQKNQQSFQTLPFSAANAWIISPENTQEHLVDSFVSWIPI